MNNFVQRSILAVAISILGCLSGKSHAQGISITNTQSIRYVIGLSPFLEKSTKDDIYRQIVGFLLADVPLDSSLWLYDAYNLRTITRMDLPDARAFRSGKTRANQFREQIGKLREFLAADHSKPETTKLSLSQAVRFPQFMDFIAQNLAETNHSIVTIVLGSPLYIDPREPAFSMVDGYFPSDGHLLATREKSIFGIKDRPHELENIVVHFGYFGDPWVSDLHQEKIARFWSLYLRGQGARLATFCGDLVTLFNSVRSESDHPQGAGRPYELDHAQTKIEMWRITRDIASADWITRDLSPALRQSPPSSSIGPMKIGIRWKGKIDLDLYATPHPGAETLNFEHMRSPQGYYYKDHRSSPDREYEFIEFESPVDIWKIDAAINFYKGSAPNGASGEVRIEFDGKIFTGNFSIAASQGNEGRSGDNQRSYWTQINIPQILKLL